MSRTWESISVWGVSQFISKGERDLGHGKVSEKFLKEESSAHS